MKRIEVGLKTQAHRAGRPSVVSCHKNERCGTRGLAGGRRSPTANGFDLNAGSAMLGSVPSFCEKGVRVVKRSWPVWTALDQMREVLSALVGAAGIFPDFLTQERFGVFKVCRPEPECEFRVPGIEGFQESAMLIAQSRNIRVVGAEKSH